MLVVCIGKVREDTHVGPIYPEHIDQYEHEEDREATAWYNFLALDSLLLELHVFLGLLEGVLQARIVTKELLLMTSLGAESN